MAFFLAARGLHRHVKLSRMLALPNNDWQQPYELSTGALAVENQLVFIW